MTDIIQGKQTGKQILRFFLLICGLTICILASQLTWILLILGLYVIFSAFSVKTKSIQISADGFELIGTSWIPFLSSIEDFKFKDIKTIKFDKGFNDLLAGIIYSESAFPVTTTKKDTIEIVKIDGSWRSISRFGERKDFNAGFKILLSNYYKFKSIHNKYNR